MSVLVDAGACTIVVQEAGPQGPPGSFEEEVPYAKRVDFVGEDTAYIGEASPGASEASPVWRIKKISFVGEDVEVRWPAGVATFANVWTDRASLTYT